MNKKKSFAGELAGSQLSIELPLWRGPNRISVRRSHRLYNQHTGSSERTGHNQVYSLLDRPLLCNALLQDVVARLCLILLSSTQLDAFYLSLRKKEEEGKKKTNEKKTKKKEQSMQRVWEIVDESVCLFYARTRMKKTIHRLITSERAIE